MKNNMQTHSGEAALNRKLLIRQCIEAGHSITFENAEQIDDSSLPQAFIRLCRDYKYLVQEHIKEREVPSAEAVKAAFAYVDADTLAPSECIKSARLLAPFRKHDEPLDFASARILAAHARATEAEVARLREALEEMIVLNETTGDPDPEVTDRARKALTGEASA